MTKKLALPIFLVAVFILLVNPLVNLLNRQRPIDPSSTLEQIGPDTISAVFHGTKVRIPSIQLAANNETTQTDVLGSKSSSNRERRIEIDLSKQKLYAYSGNKKVYSFLVSTGKWGRTPTGEFRIWTKLRATLMTGGSKALNTYYYLPNVPYTMYFYNESVPKYKGYGIHGTYWHNNFGHPMSHGCINMKTEEAEVLFNWASAESQDSSGTKIIIYGTAPAN